MAGAKRRSHTGVIERLRAEPQAFQLLQAARLLEAAGEGPVRFSGAVDEAFASSDLKSLRRERDGGQVIETGALTFFGPHGPLPQPLADAVAAQVRAGDEGARAFFDIFVNRLVRLMLDALRLERPADWPGPDMSPDGQALRALCGRLSPGRASAVDRTLAAAAGLVHQQPRSLHAAERAISAHFAAPVRARAFVGGWTPLRAADRTRLSAVRGGRLGRGATLGGAAWIEDAGFRLDVGPVGAPLLHDLLPGGRGAGALGALVDATLPREADVTCRLIVRADAAPRAVLGAKGGARLGWTSWVATRPLAADGAVDVRLSRMRDAR